MEPDLNAMSLRELRDLQARVARAIATFEDRRKKQVLAEVEELVRERGFTLAEVTAAAAGAGRRGGAKSAGAPKYANPADPSQTWTGRGRQPGWFAEAVAAGRDRESMRV